MRQNGWLRALECDRLAGLLETGDMSARDTDGQRRSMPKPVRFA